MGSETILSDEAAYKIRRELVDEIDAMISSSNDGVWNTYLGKIKQALKTNSLMCDFYWDTDKLPDFETLRKYNVVLAMNCSFFRKDKTGLWAAISEELYSGRKRVKKEMLKVEQQIVDLKASGNYDKEELKRLERIAATKHSLQLGYKIALNSLYGATSNKYFTEYFDVRISEAVTSAGQNGIQWISSKSNKYFEEITKIKYDFCAAGDTDSIYFDLQPVVDKFCQNLSTEEIVNWIDDFFQKTMEPLFIKWATEMSNSLNCKSNQLVFKREKIIESAIMVAKKRYVFKVWDSEGVRYKTPKIAVTGLEAVRSTYKKVWRDWLTEIYTISLDKTEKDVQARVKEIEKEFRNLPIEEIATVISCNDIEKHQVGDFGWAKGATKQVKAALNYRHFKYKYSLNLPDIISGDKILMVNLVKNPSGVEVIGFPEYLPTEFGLNKYIDYTDIFNKNFIDPLDTFLGSFGWKPRKTVSLKGFF